MSGKFVEKATVCEDLVKTLDKRDSTAVVLYDLIGRSSNCDYTKQLVDDLAEGEKLYNYLIDWDGSPGGGSSPPPSPTLLPSATRIYVNTDIMPKNTTQLTVGMATQRTIPFAFERDLITSRVTLRFRDDPYRNDVVINQSSIHFGLDDVLLSFEFGVTVYDGTHPPGPSHPAPTWTTPQTNLDNKTANCLQIDLELVKYTASGDNDDTGGAITSRSFISRVLMHPQDIIDQKIMKLTGALIQWGDGNNDINNRLVVTATMIGSPFNYAGQAPKIGFFKQAAASATNDSVEPDSTNFIDVISLNLAGR